MGLIINGVSAGSGHVHTADHWAAPITFEISDEVVGSTLLDGSTDVDIEATIPLIDGGDVT